MMDNRTILDHILKEKDDDIAELQARLMALKIATKNICDKYVAPNMHSAAMEEFDGAISTWRQKTAKYYKNISDTDGEE